MAMGEHHGRLTCTDQILTTHAVSIETCKTGDNKHEASGGVAWGCGEVSTLWIELALFII